VTAAIIVADRLERRGAMEQTRRKRVLNAGSGPASRERLREFFPSIEFLEVRMDIDPATRPDLVGSFADMRELVADASFEAVWSSHSLEHLHAHEALPALAEFRRVLRADGFAVVTCPDVAAVAKLLTEHDLDHVAYTSPAGPIRIHDMLYGHGPSVEAGRAHMAHKTGFTAARLGRLATQAGFAEARVYEGGQYDLWAALLTPETDRRELARRFAKTRIAGLFDLDEGEFEDDERAGGWQSHVRRRVNPAPRSAGTMAR